MIHNRSLINIFEKEYFKSSEAALSLDTTVINSEKNTSLASLKVKANPQLQCEDPCNWSNELQIIFSKLAWA